MQHLKLFLLITLLALLSNSSHAQGCVAVRQMGGLMGLNSSGYNLSKGDMQIGVNYRYFHSWRHYVGTEEQTQRQNTGGGLGADGINHGNAVNIYSHAVDLNFSYAVSNRVQLNFTLPWVHNERSQVLRQTAPVIDTFRYSVFAAGLSDIRFGANYWVFDPMTSHNGNLMIGAGVKLATGSHSETDVAPLSNGTKRVAVMDQAIQPGDGGVGISLELQAFKKIYKSVFGFANGYYLFNPKESNGTFKSAPSVLKDKSGNVLGTLTGYNVYACPDQYFARAGFMASVSDNFTFSLAGRLEGIPAYDAFGGQAAYRRPGYVIAVEPGVTFRSGNHTFSLFVPNNFVRNRVQSAADIASQTLQNSVISDATQQVHVQGDAAFADYSISIGYNYRINKAMH